MREIVLDTETTGTEHAKGDRIVEIGCVELLNHVPTGRSYHVYLNPQCPVHPGALAVHGLSNEFLADKPLFEAVVDEFLDFVGDARLVIHNAAFDVAFLNAELARLNLSPFLLDDAIDTLMLARRKHPGASNSLDALCARYGIDNSRRTKHGALLDAEILAEVYIELIGGKQTGLDLSFQPSPTAAPILVPGMEKAAPSRERPFISRLTEEERAAHEAFVATLGPDALWRSYLGLDTSA
jgi:DNA polymerase-3 subunit epsilon